MRFLQLCPHIKGPLRGKRLILEPWQCFIMLNIFGLIDNTTDKRVVRRAYVEVARGNGKSALTSALALYMLCADSEGGPEVYSAATSRDQAKIVWEASKNMAQLDKQMRDNLGLDLRAFEIRHPASHGVYKALSAEGNYQDGLNIHFAVVDELHAHKTREVFDVLLTGCGKREQSLLFSITTAGFNVAGVCFEERSYLAKILDNQAQDESFWGVIYTTDNWDSWTDKDCWAKANPNWGISVMPAMIESTFKKALAMPSSQGNFRTKHLNEWLNADHAWMDMVKWDSTTTSLPLSTFKDRSCYLALDLATKNDLCAAALVFPLDDDFCVENGINTGTLYATYQSFWLPEKAIKEERNDSYEGWVHEGFINQCRGDVVDFGDVEDWILKYVRQEFALLEVAYDPMQATQLAQNLVNEGLEMVEFRQNVLNFSEPMKEIDAMIRTGALIHEDNPVMTWCMSNVVAHLDAKDNIYPRKARAENKIDGVVALIMGIARAMFSDANSRSVYDSDEWFE
jgi:phage terminase large subunit-like protein